MIAVRSFLEGYKEGQCSDGVGCKDQCVNRHDPENILEDAGQAEADWSEVFQANYDTEKDEDLEAEADGDERSCNIERLVPAQVRSVLILAKRSHNESDSHDQVFCEFVREPKTFEEVSRTGFHKGYDVVHQKIDGKEPGKSGGPVAPVVSVEVIISKGFLHHENEKGQIDGIDEMVDDHSIDFNMDLLSEVGKEFAFICFTSI